MSARAEPDATASDDTSEKGTVGAMLDQLEEATGDGKVSLGDVLDAVGNRGHGPFLVLPALVVLTPLGGIPGVPTVAALVVLLFAVQLAFGQSQLWLPKRLNRTSVDAGKLRKSVDKLRKPADWIDRVLHRRLTALAGATATRAAAICAALLCFAVPPLELLPFGAVMPMLAIATFGLGMMANDGVVMLLGFIFAGLAVALGVWLI